MNENIIRHQNKVTQQKREEIMGQKGMVVWFTGLSGSGKSTIASEVEEMLARDGRHTYLLDGDNLRCGINSDLGFTDEERDENVRRIAEIAALFRDAGIIVLVSCISPFKKMRRFARERAGRGNFIEVYVSTDLETCIKRDPKGLYKKKISNFTGKDSSYEEPENAEIVLDTVGRTPTWCAGIVYREIQKNIAIWQSDESL